MTERTSDVTTPGTIPDPATSAGHLACAYSPRWLSGPSSYEGLVATFVPATDDDDPGVAPTESSA